MSERTPKKYISLHNHSNFSCNDALGYPDDIFSYCIENGLSGHALTDHGNMSSYARSQLLVESWHKSGKEFRYLPGIEAYFHPDLEQWKLDKLQHDDEKTGAKKKSRTPVETQLNITRSESDDIVDVDTSSAIVIENEDESKSTKHFNPVNRRHHLVLLPKNSQGLQELFHLTSRSFLEGLYRFPRIDVKMVKETLTRGNVLASSACLHPDTLLWTDRGKITIEECVRLYKNNERVDVMSWDEDKHEIVHRRVTWGDKTRYNTPIIELVLNNGAKIKLTDDHRVFTDRGWVEAGELRYDDKVLYRLESYENYCSCACFLNGASHNVACAQYPEWLQHKELKAYKDNETVEFVFVAAINHVGNSDVYDIEVVDTHNFFADDILVHNCISGLPGYNIFKLLERYKFDELDVNLLRDKQTKENCVNAVGNAYEMLVDMFGKNDTYLELQFNKLAAQDIINLSLIEFAKRNGLTNKLLVTCDAHYYNPDVWREREIYKKLAYVSFDMYSPDLLPKSREELKCELYPKNHLQIWEEYKRAKLRSDLYDDSIDDLICDAVERGHDIAFEEIGDVQPDRTIKLPKKLVPKDRTPIEHLSYLCIEGLKKRGLKGKREYVERIKEELEVIKFHNTAEYFITLAKMMELARTVVLVGPGRGSGCGSLVNYVLDITDLDPIRWKLPFARFLSIHRVGAPDVDTDISNRDKVLDVLRAEFGNENVIPISTYNLLKTKSLLKDLSKFYGIPFDEANRATATVEHEVRKATLKEGDDKNLFVLTYDAAMEHSPSFRKFIEDHPEVGNSMKILFKQNKSLGRHAGGVLVSENIPQNMPLIMSGGELQSPWTEGMNVKELEKIGNWIKYDVLGLTTLRLIEGTIELILESQGNKNYTFSDVRKWFEENLGVDNIDLNDQRVYKHIYEDGVWCAIFQCTSKGAQNFFKRAKPKSIIDIAALTSIYRPGPLAGKVDQLWMKHEHDHYDWGHPLVNETLKETRGLCVFQESVMELANKVGGFPLDRCDEIRRAIMKRSVAGGEDAKKKAASMEDDFVKGAMKNGLEESLAKKTYETLLAFSGYGFNKSVHFQEKVKTYNDDGTLKEIKQIVDVELNDILLSRDELSKKDILVRVKNKHDHGILPLVEVELTSGEKVRCTMDHKFRTVESGEMLPLWLIMKKKMSIVINS